MKIQHTRITLAFLALGLLSAQGTQAAMESCPNCLHFDGIDIMWRHTPAGDLDMTVTGKTSGWVGIGFSSDQSMLNSDMILGGVSQGSPYLLDGWAADHAPPSQDTQQNVTLISATEASGLTELRFQRPLATGDPDDFDLTQGPVYLLWAMGGSDIGGLDTAPYHLNTRGISATKIDFNVQAVPVPPALWLFSPVLAGLGAVVSRKSPPETAASATDSG